MKSIIIIIIILCCWVLCVRTDIFHEDLYISGCSASDGEDMYSLDGEELWYADYKLGKGIEPQPDFVDHVSYVEGTYDQAVANQGICKRNLDTLRQALKNETLQLNPPSSPVVYSRDDVELGVMNQLICHVTGFYPAPVTIHWTKNEQNMTEGIRLNVPFPNKDGTFQQFSSLSFVPEQGDIYSCNVEHAALQEPSNRLWEVEVTQPGLGPSIFCGVGLTVGLVGVATGTFFLIKGNECS